MKKAKVFSIIILIGLLSISIAGCGNAKSNLLDSKNQTVVTAADKDTKEIEQLVAEPQVTSETMSEQNTVKKSNNNATKTNKTVENNFKKVTVDMFGAKNFPKSVHEINYSGICEYGYVLTSKVIKDKDVATIITYKGYMRDGLGDEGGIRNFDLTYTITNNSVKQSIKNNDKHVKNKHLLDSIIPDKIVLSKSLQKNYKWEQNFLYNGKNKKAVSTIKDITVDSDKKKIYKVVTEVNNMPEYPNNKYIETVKYKEGIGIIEFSSTLAKNMGLDTWHYHIEPIR